MKLKKNQLKPHLKKQWCIELTPDFLWQIHKTPQRKI